MAKTTKKEIQKVTPITTLPVNIKEMSPAEIMFQVIEKGGDLDKIEKFIELQEKYDGIQAKKEFNVALVRVQGKMGSVKKTKDNKQTHSKYADLENVLIVSKPVCAEEGFSLSFYEGETPKADHVRICCDLIHQSGHEKNYFYDVPLDGKGIQGNANMTKIHGKAASVSYGRRYLTCMILNIATGDNDGNIPYDFKEEEKPQQAQQYAQPEETAPEPTPEPKEAVEAEFTEEKPPSESPEDSFITQTELSALIELAIKNKWNPDGIEDQFNSLGYKIKTKMKKSLKLSDIDQKVNKWDYESMVEAVSKEMLKDEPTKK